MTYTPRTKPRAHQAEALRRIAARPNEPSSLDVFALLMEMGCGKSKVILDEFGARQGDDLDDLLIIAPASAYRNWDQGKTETQLSEFEAHLNPDLYRRLAIRAWVSGNKAAMGRFKDVLDVLDRPRLLVVNVEALSSVKTVFELCKKFLSQRRSMLVVDESTTIRNRRANRTKKIIELGKYAAAKRILTGLVAPKSPMDLYAQFSFLDPSILGFDNFVTFQARYAKMSYICFLPSDVLRAKVLSLCSKNANLGVLRNRLKTIAPKSPGVETMPHDALVTRIRYEVSGMSRNDMVRSIPLLGGYVQSVPKIEGFQNLDELQTKMAPYSYRVLKDDCLDLPKKIYMPPREVKLTPEQQTAYGNMLEFATTELEGEHITASNVVSLMIRLHQIVCGYAVNECSEVTYIPSNRTDALVEVLEDHSGKAIIWLCHKPTFKLVFDRLVDEYGQEAVASFHGGNRPTRLDEEKRFLGDPECRFMISSYAGALGNTWVNASLVVYFENTYDLEKRMQSEDRSHRDGLRHPVTYVDLMVPETVDEKILYALRRKINLATSITGDNYKEWLI